MENFWLVSTQVWVLFALIGVGALCRWMRWVDDAAIKGIVNVLILCVTPCLIIDVFQRPYDPAMVRQLFAAFAVAFALHAAIIVAAILFMRGGGAARRPVLRLAMVFSNAGFMGIPLEQAILGDTGVFFGITYVVTFNTFFWSWGLHEMTAKDPSARDPSVRPSLLPIFVNPGTIGICAGFGLFLARVALPACLAQPIKMMAGMNTPLAMVVIGYYLAGANLRAVAKAPSAYAAAFARLLAYPLAVIAVLYPLRTLLMRDMMLAIVIAASAPVAAMVTMFAAKFGRDVDLSVGLVSATTLLSIITMPAIIALAMSIL